MAIIAAEIAMTTTTAAEVEATIATTTVTVEEVVTIVTTEGAEVEAVVAITIIEVIISDIGVQNVVLHRNRLFICYLSQFTEKTLNSVRKTTLSRIMELFNGWV